MQLIRWPSPQELGRRYDDWLRLALIYAIVAEECYQFGWFQELERMVRRMTTEPDGVVDMTEFVQIFYNGLAMFNFELYCIVRECLAMRF